MGEFTIELKDLWFYSFHGLYEEEKMVGGDFVVDFSGIYKCNKDQVTSLSDSVNYVSLYDIIKNEMMQAQALLEKVASNIVNKVHQQFPEFIEVQVCITKKNPPIAGIRGSVAVRLKKKF